MGEGEGALPPFRSSSTAPLATEGPLSEGCHTVAYQSALSISEEVREGKTEIARNNNSKLAVMIHILMDYDRLE